jgi:ribonuclease inhibitor
VGKTCVRLRQMAKLEATMKSEIDGNYITSETEFHQAIATALNFSGYYGRNLDALIDVLSMDVERPLLLIWKNSSHSKLAIGPRFDLIVKVLRFIEQQDIELGRSEKFEFNLN